MVEMFRTNWHKKSRLLSRQIELRIFEYLLVQWESMERNQTPHLLGGTFAILSMDHAARGHPNRRINQIQYASLNDWSSSLLQLKQAGLVKIKDFNNTNAEGEDIVCSSFKFKILNIDDYVDFYRNKITELSHERRTPIGG